MKEKTIYWYEYFLAIGLLGFAISVVLFIVFGFINSFTNSIFMMYPYILGFYVLYRIGSNYTPNLKKEA